MTDSSCLFCKIVAGEIPADVVHEDARLVAFRDIAPQAPVHVLVIPKEHVSSLEMAGDGDTDLLGEMLLAAREIARAEGIAEAGYRCVVNTGDAGGQSVHHLHVHVLGGRFMGWPPG
jgi:histidine triad (HIT) family protein